MQQIRKEGFRSVEIEPVNLGEWCFTRNKISKASKAGNELELRNKKTSLKRKNTKAVKEPKRFEYVNLTYCQSALLRASLHILSASSRGGSASRILFRILKSTIHGNGNVALSCKMSDATSGGVVYRGRSDVEFDETGSVIWRGWLANLIGVGGYSESAPTDSPRPSVCLVEDDGIADESALAGGGGNGVVPYSSCDVLILSRSGAKRGCRWFEHCAWTCSKASSSCLTRSLSSEILSCSCSVFARINLKE